VKVGTTAVGVGLGLGSTTGCKQADRPTATSTSAAALLRGTRQQA
jgi:hypothetical protein